MALHEQAIGATDDWFTPPYIFDALGCRFDVDVASPGRDVTPWIPAKIFVTWDSLSKPWRGFVWMNAPFGGRNGLMPWLDKFFRHANGVALVPDRTSAPWWQRFAPQADLILFVAPKIRFIGADGKPGCSPAQGTCLLASGAPAVKALRCAHAHKLGVLMQPAPKDLSALRMLMQRV
jgi:hypothetical protein